MKSGSKVWMLRNSPYNEDVIWKASSTEEGIIQIAVNYIREMFGDVTKVDGRIDFKKKIVEVKYESYGEMEDKTFYLSEVEIL
jgi:hypothetical protein